jgi:hypothetical protein
MSSPLEKFILENREKFDADAPDSRVWEKINEKINPEAQKPVPIHSIPLKRWMTAAAAVLLVAVSGVLYYTLHRVNPQPSIAGKSDRHVVTSANNSDLRSQTDSPAQIARTIPDTQQQNVPDVQNQETHNKQELKSPDNEDSKEMYYYAKLIELKHEELKTLEKDEPLLYRQFSGDVQKLDSVYHTLKTQLPNNSNREQVIEAMISNLQLQIGLLNKQLGIIKKIKHSKKSAYEKAYKSV